MTAEREIFALHHSKTSSAVDELDWYFLRVSVSSAFQWQPGLFRWPPSGAVLQLELVESRRHGVPSIRRIELSVTSLAFCLSLAASGSLVFDRLYSNGIVHSPINRGDRRYLPWLLEIFSPVPIYLSSASRFYPNLPGIEFDFSHHSSAGTMDHSKPTASMRATRSMPESLSYLHGLIDSVLSDQFDLFD